MAAAVVAGVAACAPHPADPAPADAPAAKSAKVTATVIGVDPQNRTITLQQAPIPEWGWPALRMAYEAPPEAIAGFKEGDRVTADLKMVGATPKITALSKL